MKITDGTPSTAQVIQGVAVDWGVRRDGELHMELPQQLM